MGKYSVKFVAIRVGNTEVGNCISSKNAYKTIDELIRKKSISQEFKDFDIWKVQYYKNDGTIIEKMVEYKNVEDEYIIFQDNESVIQYNNKNKITERIIDFRRVETFKEYSDDNIVKSIHWKNDEYIEVKLNHSSWNNMVITLMNSSIVVRGFSGIDRMVIKYEGDYERDFISDLCNGDSDELDKVRKKINMIKLEF